MKECDIESIVSLGMAGSEEYVKAIRAPLSDAKLLAVGGVNADNAGNFFEMGFCGIGVGSNLYDKKLIKEKKFDALNSIIHQAYKKRENQNSLFLFLDKSTGENGL